MKFRIAVAFVSFVVLSLPAVIWAGDLAALHTFKPGQTIKSSEVNENFEALRADLSAGGRSIVFGANMIKSINSNAIFVTPLDHPLLNGNPEAIVLANVADARGFTACWEAQSNKAGIIIGSPLVGYEDGVWWLWGSCPGTKYNVVFFKAKG